MEKLARHSNSNPEAFEHRESCIVNMYDFSSVQYKRTDVLKAHWKSQCNSEIVNKPLLLAFGLFEDDASISPKYETCLPAGLPIQYRMYL